MKRWIVVLFFMVFAADLFAETQEYTVVRRLSHLTFEVSAQLHDVEGESRDFSGTIIGDPQDITTAKISLRLDPKNFDTRNDKRDKDMREKCLEIDQYPYIEFESTMVEADSKQLVAGQPLSATVHGVLKLHGIEKQIAVPVKILWKNDTITAEGSMEISLDEFKILRPRVLFVQLQDLVKIQFKVGARRLK